MHWLCSIDAYRSCNVESELHPFLVLLLCHVWNLLISPVESLVIGSSLPEDWSHAIFYIIGFHSFSSDNHFTYFLSLLNLGFFFPAFLLHSFHMIYFSSPSSVPLKKVLISWLVSSRRHSVSTLYPFPILSCEKEIKLLANISKTSRMQVKTRPPWRLLWDFHCHSLHRSFLGQLRCLFHLSNAVIVVKLAIHQTATFEFIFKQDAVPDIILILNTELYTSCPNLTVNHSVSWIVLFISN